MSSKFAGGRYSPIPERNRQLYQIMDGLPDSSLPLAPFFWAEVRIDFNDVRTGFREMVSLSKALEIYSGTADLLWTDDMIRDVDPAKTSSSAPEGVAVGTLPAFVDANFFAVMESRFVQYLLRSFEVKIYRNFDLNLYSLSGESRSEFRARCLELLDGARREELYQLHEVYKRRLEQARQKYLTVSESQVLEQARTESRNKTYFSRCCERVAQLFYNAELRVDTPLPSQQEMLAQELDEKLIAVELEAHQSVAELQNRYEEKAGKLDEYILHPNLKDIHFVRSCILWMPKGAV